jgi:hypothetical protein
MWRPGVAELADAADSKSAEALLRVGSTPSSGTISFPQDFRDSSRPAALSINFRKKYPNLSLNRFNIASGHRDGNV